MKKNENLRSFITSVMALAVMCVLSLSFTACGDEDDFLTTTGTEVPGGNDKPSDPNWKVVAVDGTNCVATAIEWKSSENVSLSSRAYADADMEGFANAVVSHKYTAEIEYADANKTQGNMFKSESKSYTSSLMARLFSLKNAMVFDSVEALENATGKVTKLSDEQGYELYAINFGGSRQVVVKNSTTLSTSSLSFEGISKSDLCSANFGAPEFDSKYYSKVTSDKEGFDKYEMTVKVKLTAEEAGSDNVRYLVFKVENVYVAQSGNNGSDDPVVGPSDKEVVGYAVRNNQFDGNNTKGDIVKIYDDLSEEKVGSFNVPLNHSTVTPQDVTQDGLSSLAWEQGETTSVELAATGNTRAVEVEAGCKVQITEVFSSVTNRSKVPMTFKGIYETARIMFPDGTSADLLVGTYEMSDGEVEAIASSETSVTIEHSAYAKFNGETPVELTAKVILNKATDPEVKENEVGIIIENFEVRDDNYVFDIVHYWTISEPTRESVTIPNYAAISAEEEQSTTSRNYNTTTPNMIAGSTEDYSKTTDEGTKINGTVTSYTSDFSFEGVDGTITVSSKYLNFFEVVSKADNKAVWDIKTSAIKTGVTMGTTDKGDETKHIYYDKVHFALPINSVNVATCEQVLVYSENITPSEPEKDPVTDVDYREKSNTLETIKGIPTGVLVITIIDSEGGERDTTIYRPYPKAGVTFGGIADFTSEDKTFTTPTISNNGRATTETDGDVTYSIQKKVAKSNKFEEEITVINGSSKNLSLGGKTFTFKSTNFDVNVVETNQSETSTFNEGYDVWASEVIYDVHTTKFNILVERAPIYVEVKDQILSGAITVTVDKNTTPMLSLVISCKNKTIIYSSAYDFKNPTNWVNLKTTPSVHEAFEFKNIPSATLNGEGSNRVPANLIVAENQWAYYAKGYIRGFSPEDVLTTGCKNPVIAVGELQSDGSLKIKNGNDTVYFTVK